MVEPVQPERLTGTQDTDIGAQAAWEEAFVSFESPEQERRKFIRRLKGLGVDRWDKELRVLELFCGGGSGLSAWEQMGFENIEGMDISATPEMRNVQWATRAICLLQTGLLTWCVCKAGCTTFI